MGTKLSSSFTKVGWQLFTFEGYQSGRGWDSRELDAKFVPTSRDHHGRVGIVAPDRDIARVRAIPLGWINPQPIGARALRGPEIPQKARAALASDSHVGSHWLPLADALELAYGELLAQEHISHALSASVNIFFQPSPEEPNDERGPHINVESDKDGAALLNVGLGQGAVYPPDLAEILQRSGWKAPTGRFHRGFMKRLAPGWSITQALHECITPLRAISALKPNALFYLSGQIAPSENALALLNPLPKGDRTYYRMHDDPLDLGQQRADIRAKPIKHERLSAEERETFVARNSARFPDVHDWSDNDILLALFHGA